MLRRAVESYLIAFLACVSFLLSSCSNSSQPAGEEKTASHALEPESPNPLLGKPLQPFVTVDPDGNTVDLSKHLGKEVILLDFWATWCRPCLMAMPEVQQVAKEFKERGLVFYAMNVGEDPDTVKQFLAANEIDIPVAMDFDGKIQSMYRAQDLPHTLVIGKDGRLQVDHRGYWKGFGKELSAQVEALLEGNDLVGAAASE